MEAQLSNKIFEVKDKLTDGEFKDLMDTLQGVYNEKKEKDYALYEIDYVIPKLTMKCTMIEVDLELKSAIIKLSCKDEFNQQQGEMETEKHFLERVERGNGRIYANYMGGAPQLRTNHSTISGYTWCHVCNEECCGECGESTNPPVDFTCHVKNEFIHIVKYNKLE